MRRLTLRCAVAVLAVALSGCVTTVARIADDPQGYADRPVQIRGTIERGISIPFVDQSVYLFADDTGKALLISNESLETDTTIMVRGRVVAFPEDRSKEAVADATARLEQLLVSSGLADENKAGRIASAIAGAAGSIAERLGGLFLIVHEAGGS